jgi:hypothetical protein
MLFGTRFNHNPAVIGNRPWTSHLPTVYLCFCQIQAIEEQNGRLMRFATLSWKDDMEPNGSCLDESQMPVIMHRVGLVLRSRNCD